MSLVQGNASRQKNVDGRAKKNPNLLCMLLWKGSHAYANSVMRATYLTDPRTPAAWIRWSSGHAADTAAKTAGLTVGKSAVVGAWFPAASRILLAAATEATMQEHEIRRLPARYLPKRHSRPVKRQIALLSWADLPPSRPDISFGLTQPALLSAPCSALPSTSSRRRMPVWYLRGSGSIRDCRSLIGGGHVLSCRPDWLPRAQSCLVHNALHMMQQVLPFVPSCNRHGFAIGRWEEWAIRVILRASTWFRIYCRWVPWKGPYISSLAVLADPKEFLGPEGCQIVEEGSQQARAWCLALAVHIGIWCRWHSWSCRKCDPHLRVSEHTNPSSHCSVSHSESPCIERSRQPQRGVQYVMATNDGRVVLTPFCHGIPDAKSTVLDSSDHCAWVAPPPNKVTHSQGALQRLSSNEHGRIYPAHGVTGRKASLCPVFWHKDRRWNTHSSRLKLRDTTMAALPE